MKIREIRFSTSVGVDKLNPRSCYSEADGWSIDVDDRSGLVTMCHADVDGGALATIYPPPGTVIVHATDTPQKASNGITENTVDSSAGAASSPSRRRR